jgi:hypothetical protein
VSARDKEVSVRLVVHEAAARHLLDGQADALRARLAGLGYALGRFDVRQDGHGGSAPHRHDRPAEAEQPARPAPGAARPRRNPNPGITGGGRGVDIIA